MGMFDSVMVACPNCGAAVEFQSKAWECGCSCYSLDSAPAEILADIMNDPHYCQCGQWFALIDPRYPPGQKPKPALRAARVRSPTNPIVHFQGFRWWPDGLPFTYDDLQDSPPSPAPAPEQGGG